MDLITIVAWMMAVAMFAGVVGGWLVFIVAWVHHWYVSGYLRLPRRSTRRVAVAPSADAA